MSILQIDGAEKRYGEILALRQVSFEVQAGEIVGLLGPNGSGKSTLMRSIATLEKLDSGKIQVAGHDVQSDSGQVRNHLGYAGQEMAIDKVLTGREFLRFQAAMVHLPKSEIESRTTEMLQRLDLTDAADRLCEGYSGGMRRRLDLAASLMHKPKLLILDEPSTGLDLEARHRLWELLRELRQEGTALLLATHDFEEADVLADRVVLMGAGQVGAVGMPASLREGLGAWIVSASLHEHVQPKDHEKLQALFAKLPGKLLPIESSEAGMSMALPSSDNADLTSGKTWTDALQAEAARQNLTLFSLAVHKPTLQDVYRFALSQLAA